MRRFAMPAADEYTHTPPTLAAKHILGALKDANSDERVKRKFFGISESERKKTHTCTRGIGKTLILIAGMAATLGTAIER